MDAQQTPDAVREALQAKHDHIHPNNRRRDLPIMLKMTFGDLCAILAALDSRAGDAPPCRYAEMGSYDGQVQLVPPPHMARDDGRGICVDVCLASEVSALWKVGIRTTGCCCGHGKAPPYIGVSADHAAKMVDLGYERIGLNEWRPKTGCYAAHAVDAVPAGEVRNLRPNLGAETDEPSLEEMVLDHYRRHYPIGEAFNLRDRYFAALSHGEGRK